MSKTVNCMSKAGQSIVKFFKAVAGPFRRASHRIESKRGFLFKRSKREKVIFGILFLIFCVYAFTLIYPLFWLIINSLKDTFEYNMNVQNLEPFKFPSKLVWQNYVEVMNNLDDRITFPGMFFNSLWYAGVGSFLSVFMSSVVAYCLSRFEFRGRNVLYAVAIFSMTIPIVGTMGAQFKLEVDIGIYDSPLHVIVLNLGGLGGIYFLIMHGFFKNISHAYSEAVYIDGGGEFVVFFRVMLPQGMSMMFVLMLMNFIGGWNDYTATTLYLPSYPTLASGMYQVANTLQRTGRVPIYFAGLVMSVIPILLLFCVFGNKMMTSVSIGGLKG